MNTPTIAANTNARNEPLPAATSATGTMMNTDDAGVTPDRVMKTLPRMPIDRFRSCSYRAVAGAPAAASAGPSCLLCVSSISRTSSKVARWLACYGFRGRALNAQNMYESGLFIPTMCTWG